MIEQLALCLFVVLTLAGGVMAAGMRHILHAIIGLGISLLGIAGLFLHLGSPFVAAMQILIYIGGIVVAIVFAMMLSLSMTVQPPKANRIKAWFAAISSAFFLVSVSLLLSTADFHTIETPPPTDGWAVAHIGHALLNRYKFLGGWNGPVLPGFVWFFLKVYALILLMMWFRWTFPRLRFDQLMTFAWAVLVPLALINLLVTTVAIKLL